jgi:hypothetical protein
MLLDEPRQAQLLLIVDRSNEKADVERGCSDVLTVARYPGEIAEQCSGGFRDRVLYQPFLPRFLDEVR